uniref:Uncharacterized protein n=1 Tax=Oryza rufipogon TaxID=4529 RepID=A0A0E0NBY4_ORYRU
MGLQGGALTDSRRLGSEAGLAAAVESLDATERALSAILFRVSPLLRMQYPDFRRALTHNIASGRTLFGRDLLGITNKPEGLFAKNPPPSSAPSAPHNILPISPVSLSPPLLKNESRARGCRSPSGEESRSEQVNTRQQTERSAKKKANGAAIANTSTLFQMLQCVIELLQLFQTEGWGGLYSGLKPSLIGTAASQGIYYYFYQILKNKVGDLAVARGKKGLGDGTVGMFSWLGIAAVAGSINVLLTNPIWVLVTRMQTHTQAEKKIMESKKELLLKDVARANSIEVSILKDRLYKLDSEKPRPYGTIQAVREVYRESGIRGFWKGLIPTLIMVCNPSIQFMIYETLAKRLRSKRSGKELPKKNLTAMEVFLLGAIAKLGATVVTYPLLVVKSRLQAKQEIGRNVMSRYTGTIDAIVKMIRYEGLHGFYKGMGTKIVQSVFAASVLFMVKEELVKFVVMLIARSRTVLGPSSKKR